MRMKVKIEYDVSNVITCYEMHRRRKWSKDLSTEHIGRNRDP